jgi:hypothetical protein
MIKLETRTIAREEQHLVGFECDICEEEAVGTLLPDTWYEYDAGCGDVECPDCQGHGGVYHACSPFCYFKMVNKFLEKADIASANLLEFVSPLYIDGL